MINKTQKKILLTGARSPCALELARQLHFAGHSVFAADTSTMHVLKFSNSIEKFYTIPSPRFDGKGFIKTLNEIVVKEKIDLMVPVWEEVMYLSLYKDQLPKSCEVFCSPFKLVHELHNKWLFIKLLNALEVKAPRSVLLHTQEDLQDFAFEAPYILKKCFSRGSRDVFKVMTAEIPKINIEPDNPWIAQEFIKGKNYCSFSVCYQGKLLAHTAYPVQYTIDGSSCVAFEAIDHPAIADWVISFVKKINYTGQIAFDFIETEERQLYSIECNPRATSGIHLFKLEDRLADAYFHQNTQVIKPNVGNSQQIVAGMLMYGLRSGVIEKKLSLYIKKLLTTKDVVFSSKDIKPFLFEPLVLTSYWLNSRKSKRSIPALFTYDLEWDEDPK